MRKRKIKRYAGEDESLVKDDEMKRRGLEASKNERVGFFERLRMGNIDDPRSEAYKRFGAGRGLAESNKNVPIVERSRKEEKVDSGRGMAGFGSPTLDIKKETRTVEKEDREPDSVAGVGARNLALEDSEDSVAGKGARNLALKDLDESPKPRVYPESRDKTKVQPESTRKAEATTSSKMTSAKEIMERGRAGPVQADRKPKSKDEEKYGKSKRLKALVETFTGRDSGKSSDSDLPSKASDTGKSERLKALSETFKRAGQPYDNPFAKKYKSGGKVSSASSRADGIATRGKTRGKIV